VPPVRKRSRRILTVAESMRLRVRREKVFGSGRAVPLDRNAKARIAACALFDRLS
jgi:hypothetical protein